MRSDSSGSRPVSRADAELAALLAEIPSWDEATLLHMYRRYGESRLFRIHHDPEKEMTARAQRLRAAVRACLEDRGIAVPEDAKEEPSP